ncbi:hypothetical protein QBC35DRAFT_479658 [Podospora australis]|uniref:DUF7137 domain-containing protein n=1 Tax=Podospora australis TaxID=1536484 RepID=A0AAN6X468_9PEZI|nr:hypothetical protein QBC35DRAFT_479658 [Podospora australis]
MKVTSTLAVALLSLTPAVSALSWPRWLPELDTLVVRQDDGDSESSPQPTSSASQRNSAQSSGTSSITEPPKPSQVNLNTAGISQTGRVTGNATRTSPPRKTQFDLNDPPGSVVMVTPDVFAGNQLYKLGDFVTWQWNYTNLQGTPTAIDVLITNTDAKATWTLTHNMTFSEVGKFTWDTKPYTTDLGQPLLDMAQYTLMIHDSEGSPTDRPEPGYLAPFTNWKFGMYKGQSYTDSADGYVCASCSGANGLGIDRKAMGAAVTMSIVTVLSFTWFVAGFGGVL